MTMTVQGPAVPASLEGLEAVCRRLMAEIVKMPPPRGFDGDKGKAAKLRELDEQLDLWNIVSTLEA